MKKTINGSWRFDYYPSWAEFLEPSAPVFDDSGWMPVSIPHTWSTYETTRELHPYIRNVSEKDNSYWWHGWGWYRKHFSIDREHRGKKIFLEFDGVQKYSKVWVNGEYAGEHKGGYSSFYFDITNFVEYDRDNVIAVEVCNRRNDKFGGIAPMSAGNFNVYGGIYRDVRIVIKDRLYIPFQGSADHEGGTFVTTPEVSETSARVNIKTYVKNEYDDEKICDVLSTILDADGNMIQRLESRQAIKPGVTLEFDQTSYMISEPKLWSPETPYVYKIDTKIYADGHLKDECESPFGFRWFRWDYEENFLYLNGKKVHIHGTNRHQEYPWLGDAIPKWMHEEDLKDIRFSLGHNFMRTCHYTQDKMVYDLCDQYGIISCEEVPNIKYQEFGEDIQRQNVIEMIRRDRNHPSIVMWSMGNETNNPADEKWALEEDTTRIIHFRHSIGKGIGAKHTHKQLEMENLLRCTIRGWYNADIKNLEPEFGQHTGHEEYQHYMAMQPSASGITGTEIVCRNGLHMNGVMWLYADHGADREYVNSPLKHINPKGWVDSYRIPKYMYYLWAANWSEKPIIYIHPYDWNLRYKGQERNITVNSNCDYVELKVNGIVKGRLYPNSENCYTVVFKKTLVTEGTITAEGKRGGKHVAAEVRMAGLPTSVVLEASHREISADRSGISIIKADITDENGVHVYGATNELNWEIWGPGTLVGPSKYTTDRDKCEEMEGTMYIDTPVCMPVRSKDEPGKIKIKVTSPGLKAAELDIYSVFPVSEKVNGIYEPSLPTSGITGVTKKEYMVEKDDEEEYAKLIDINVEIQLPLLTQDEYAKAIDAFIRKKSRARGDLDYESMQYKALIKVFAAHFAENQGLLVADDFNFIAERYNSCNRICCFIDKSDFNVAAKKSLKQEYINEMVVRGLQKDYNEEVKRISSILKK